MMIMIMFKSVSGSGIIVKINVFILSVKIRLKQLNGVSVEILVCFIVLIERIWLIVFKSFVQINRINDVEVRLFYLNGYVIRFIVIDVRVKFREIDVEFLWEDMCLM